MEDFNMAEIMKGLQDPNFMNQMQNDPMFKSLMSDPRVNGLFDVSQFLYFSFSVYLYFIYYVYFLLFSFFSYYLFLNIVILFISFKNI